MAITEKVRHINKSSYIIVRCTSIQNVEQLYKLGADYVLPEKLEIAIDLLNRVLIKRLIPQKEVNRIITHIRNTNLGVFSEKDEINQPSILDEFSSFSISAIKVEADSDVAGNSVHNIDIHKKTGATLLALKRGSDIIEHPESDTIIREEDIAFLLGNPEQINFAAEMFTRKNQ
jgi:CPA2 family monovalent cation:H+ antiporter-2